MKMIPLYSHEGELLDYIEQFYVDILEKRKQARVIRHRKGMIKRVILFKSSEAPDPLGPHSYATRYSYRQHLDNGFLCWRFKSLEGFRSERNLTGPISQDAILKVISSCIVAEEAVRKKIQTKPARPPVASIQTTPVKPSSSPTVFPGALP